MSYEALRNIASFLGFDGGEVTVTPVGHDKTKNTGRSVSQSVSEATRVAAGAGFNAGAGAPRRVFSR